MHTGEHIEADGPGGPWFIRLHADHMTIARADGARSHDVPQPDVATKLEWQGLTADRPHLTAHLPKPLVLRVDPRDASRLLGWLGPPRAANMAAILRRQSKWSFAIAAAWLLGSLPVQGDEAAGLESIPFDPLAATLGAVLVLHAVLVRWRPHRSQFMLYALWLALASFRCVSNAFAARDLLPLMFWFTIAGVLLGFAVQSGKLFFHFEHSA